MSTAAGREETLSTTAQGFEIEKTVEEVSNRTDVILEITSTYGDPSTVEISERLPDDIGESHIGILEDQGPDDYSFEDGSYLTLSVVVEGNATRTVIYGVRHSKTAESNGEEVEEVRFTDLVVEPQVTSADVDGDDIESAEASNTDDEGGIALFGPDESEAGEAPANSESLEPIGADPAVVDTDKLDDDDAEERAGKSAEDAVAVSQPASKHESASTPSTAETGDIGRSDLEIPESVETDPRILVDVINTLEANQYSETVASAKIEQLEADLADVRGYLPAIEELLEGDTNASDLESEVAALHESLDRLDERLTDIEDWRGGFLDALDRDSE